MITIAQRFRRRPARAVKPEAVQPQGADPYAESLSLPDVLRELDAREALEAAAAPGVPTFTPHPGLAALTAPQPVLREPGRTLNGFAPVRSRQQAMPVLRRVRDALARGLTPLAEATAAAHVPAGRLPQVSARRVFVAEKRLARVPLPGIGGDYNAYMEAVDRITHTTGPRLAFATVAADGGEHDDR